MSSSTVTPTESDSHITSYPRFIGRSLWLATEGSFAFYAWMTMLTALFLVGANAWANQVAGGMISTHMTDHVSWGLYIANFTFMVGLAAGGVMMVIPAYLYHDRKMHDVVIIGELLAIAAIVMCLMFVVADLGRPDRFWHMVPGIGKFNFPISMLTWDVIVLNGYLILNLHICGYLLYMRFLGRQPNPVWYVPFVMLSIIWAISIHTVTAFLYCGLGGRPFWNTALLAPRFLASAFVSGPAFIIVTMAMMRGLTQVKGLERPIATLTKIIRVTILINLLMVVSELFTEFYTGGSHVSAAKYLFFGLHGKTALVPWTWTAIGLNITAACLFLWPGLLGPKFRWLLVSACLMAFVGAWIEKGMGLIVPGFIPSTLHEVVEYVPSMLEWKVTIGIWAFGLMVFTIAIKTALPTLRQSEPS
ncbi:sulfate reduction electron transfer complex DsrMKJOP subunit DsrP [Rubripirellula reticaptiva]|uniref:Polysulfide reductase, NrfD n=1 Tax=Rubripirellula reticaptiva TaxID=2528013 RepID=A0A5C6EEJ7_9BACT|nr:NrfD/PsrC family molybdoenzyme membrane anchor subunit [Rubripirellula reticaptiva]TWU46915.1 Polysulfide reductase, NrfD [Rubripirellula reticaptiva]